MERCEGYVNSIIYRSPTTSYTVLTLGTKPDGEELTCVGNFPFIDVGESIAVEGEWTRHEMYGRQFKVETVEILTPQETESIERYLGSGAIKGVGIVLAMKIVKAFGEDTFRIIEREPERLAEIRGISERMAMSIHEQYIEKKDSQRVILFLQRFGINLSLASKIYAKYGSKTETYMRENPYRIAEDIPGVGFKTADEIASRIGGFDDSETRVRACILYVLQTAMARGHAYLPEGSLLSHLKEYLPGADEDMVSLAINSLVMDRKLRVVRDPETDEQQIYAAVAYAVESTTARMLLDLDVPCICDEWLVQNVIDRIQAEQEIEFDEIQAGAIREAVRHGVFLLTGGPGTGKTTIINAIIRVLEQSGKEVVLAAPTGRAAKRMSEATGRDAATIHRLLEVKRGDDDETAAGNQRFGRNEENPLEADAVVIDETSMVDMFLMHALLRAIKPGVTRLILVGDASQLPSVGPGNVLADLLQSGAFSSVQLTRIFRQAEQSDIVINAHRINEGKLPEFRKESRDFFLMQRNDAAVIRGLIVTLVRDKLPKYVSAEPYDIQVLTPMRKGELGVESLNVLLQEALNPPRADKVEREAHGVIFREGDKVMQIRNNYDLEWEIRTPSNTLLEAGSGVFNGDIGIIRRIIPFAEEMEIVFDEDRVVNYLFSDLDDLEHAYAVTIHKAQGSEYPAVVMPLLSAPRVLMTRNLLYTGVTRAVRCVTILGSEATVNSMVNNVDELKRYTGLCRMIREQVF